MSNKSHWASCPVLYICQPILLLLALTLPSLHISLEDWLLGSCVSVWSNYASFHCLMEGHQCGDSPVYEVINFGGGRGFSSLSEIQRSLLNHLFQMPGCKSPLWARSIIHNYATGWRQWELGDKADVPAVPYTVQSSHNFWADMIWFCMSAMQQLSMSSVMPWCLEFCTQFKQICCVVPDGDHHDFALFPAFLNPNPICTQAACKFVCKNL